MENNGRNGALSNDNTESSDLNQICVHSLRVTLPPETDNATRRTIENMDVQISVTSGVGVTPRNPPSYEDVQYDRDSLPSYDSLMKK